MNPFQDHDRSISAIINVIMLSRSNKADPTIKNNFLLLDLQLLIVYQFILINELQKFLMRHNIYILIPSKLDVIYSRVMNDLTEVCDSGQ